MGEDLAAKATAGEGRHDIELMSRHAESGRHQPADIVVHRGVRVDRELAEAGAVVGYGSHRLHWLRPGPWPAQLAADDMVGPREILVHRPEIEASMEGNI